MTVAASCNLSDGVVLAVDSAVTVPDGAGGVAKIYENAEKLFQLGDRPIGIAGFGLGALGSRAIGSYLHEFETLVRQGKLTAPNALADVVEALLDFFLDSYRREVVPLLEQLHGVDFKDIPLDQVPALGLVVGGFSDAAFLSEVWEITIPLNDTPGSATLRNAQGQFGTTWFAMFDPIRRYLKGFDPQLLDEVLGYITNQRGGTPLTAQEIADIQAILDGHEYQIPFAAMPMDEGIAHTRFLAELVVSHYRYAVGAPMVGGKVKVGSVTYRGGRFQIHDETP